MKPISSNCILMANAFLVFMNKDNKAEVTVVCQGYLRDPNKAGKLGLTTEPGSQYNLFTVWKTIAADDVPSIVQQLSSCFNVLDVWAEPGYLPEDPKYPKMPMRVEVAVI